LLLGRKTAREKIATFLIMILTRSQIAEQGTKESGASISLPLTREAMADYLGLTIETVSRQFSAMRKEGLIILNGRRYVVIPDPDALRAVTGTA
jgi:CRP/FNR family transcriptional regulator